MHSFVSKPIVDTGELLKKSKLKDTQPRRMVLEALAKINMPVSPYGIQKWLLKKNTELNAVTIYRILHAFNSACIVHRHPCSGHFALCTLPEQKGHHGFLHCHSCGLTEEFCSPALCTLEHGIAKKAGFDLENHMNEISGLCKHCKS